MYEGREKDDQAEEGVFRVKPVWRCERAAPGMKDQWVTGETVKETGTFQPGEDETHGWDTTVIFKFLKVCHVDKGIHSAGQSRNNPGSFEEMRKGSASGTTCSEWDKSQLRRTFTHGLNECGAAEASPPLL